MKLNTYVNFGGTCAEAFRYYERHLGGKVGMYEPVHGSAPDLAGKDVANPLATILTVGLMLRHSFDEADAAGLIEAAVEAVLNEGFRTQDIQAPGCRLTGCREMGQLVRDRIR